MKIYTRSGDAGQTGLFGAGRVAKDDPLVEACGAVDELNAWLGLAAAAAAGEPLARLRAVQQLLFRLGADLATPLGARASGHVERIGPGEVRQLEGWIDEAQAGLEPLRGFILPGGGELGSRLHVARTVCRRAERRLVGLKEKVNPRALVFLNRLSDLLFVWARWANREEGLGDIPWSRAGPTSGGSRPAP